MFRNIQVLEVTKVADPVCVRMHMLAYARTYSEWANLSDAQIERIMKNNTCLDTDMMCSILNQEQPENQEESMEIIKREVQMAYAVAFEYHPE